MSVLIYHDLHRGAILVCVIYSRPVISMMIRIPSAGIETFGIFHDKVNVGAIAHIVPFVQDVGT